MYLHDELQKIYNRSQNIIIMLNIKLVSQSCNYTDFNGLRNIACIHPFRQDCPILIISHYQLTKQIQLTDCTEIILIASISTCSVYRVWDNANMRANPMSPIRWLQSAGQSFDVNGQNSFNWCHRPPVIIDAELGNLQTGSLHSIRLNWVGNRWQSNYVGNHDIIYCRSVIRGAILYSDTKCECSVPCIIIWCYILSGWI